MELDFVLVARFVEGPLGVAGSEHSGAGEPASAYERFAGAARRPLTGKWRRREPERTVLHATVRAHLRTFLEEARARTDEGAGLPRFVKSEFERYLACGILAHGFARVRCGGCGDELLVAFSCYPQRETICTSRSERGGSPRERSPLGWSMTATISR
jgi:hypothetical protein